jgi:LPXTG-motif cell wall-anchored protein
VALTQRRTRLAAALGFALTLFIGVTFSVMPAAHAQTDQPCKLGDFQTADGKADITSYLACFGNLTNPNPPGPECPKADLSIAAAATPADVSPGGSTTVTIGGFAPNSEVQATLCGNGIASVLGTFLVDAAGNVTATVTIPSNTPCGVYNLATTGNRANGVSQVAYATVNVTCVISGPLPVTGSDTGQLVGLAGVLLALGGAAAFGSRRMKGRNETDGLTAA